MTTLKKILTDSEKVTANLISKARKAKGVAQWAKLEPLKEKLEGKQQAHIQFTSYNPKAYGKQRTLASREGALDFLMGYVSPQFFVAPYHLQIINPDLTDEQAKDWLRKLGHPSRVAPSADKAEAPEGDVEQGFCHDSVAGKYPGKQISLFGEVTDQPESAYKDKVKNPVPDVDFVPLAQEEDHPVDPAFVETHSEQPQEQVGNPQDMILACPFGGGSRCRAQGGSGSPFHHINSDSMKSHIEKMAADGGVSQLPKLGSFKGDPALFFEHKGSPYVAIPTRQEVYAKSGAVYKWSFLCEGPLAQSNPFLAKVMNQMAPRKPVVIPQFNVSESVVTIAHDSVPSEDPQLCSFVPEVFQLVKDYFPRPGSVIPLGIVKGEKIFAVVTARSLDFYNEQGEDSFFQAADGMYYAFFDLTGKDTPALVLLSFINLFLAHIDTTPLEQQLQHEEDAKQETVVGEPSPGFDVPVVASAMGSFGVVTPNDDNLAFAKRAQDLLDEATKLLGEYDVTALSKPKNWESFDLPPFTGWKFAKDGKQYLVCNEAIDVHNGKTKTGKSVPMYRLYLSNGKFVLAHKQLTSILSTVFPMETDPAMLAAAGLIGQSFPAGSTVWSVMGGENEAVPSESPFAEDDPDYATFEDDSEDSDEDSP